MMSVLSWIFAQEKFILDLVLFCLPMRSDAGLEASRNVFGIVHSIGEKIFAWGYILPG